MNVLKNDDGTLIRGNQAILKKCTEHFMSLYASKQIQHNRFPEFALGENVPRLSQEDKLSCEGPITYEECKFATSKMARNKTAGVSGFSAEFLSFFWEELGSIVVDYINDAKIRKQLFVSHRRGILTLIPKKGDQKLLVNKRPICLLDVIYKLIAKVIATRMGKVINKIIHSSQTGFMKGRYTYW